MNWHPSRKREMEVVNFKEKIADIIRHTENTNFGSLNNQYKLLNLTLEFYLKNQFSHDQVREYYSSADVILDFEAQIESYMEVYENLHHRHKTQCILCDLGEDFSKNLFRDLKAGEEMKTLFRECNS